LIYYRKEVYSKKYPNTHFKLIGYNEVQNKIVLDIGGNIKEYVVYTTPKTDAMYFAYRGKRYYLEEFYFKQWK